MVVSAGAPQKEEMEERHQDAAAAAAAAAGANNDEERVGIGEDSTTAAPAAAASVQGRKPAANHSNGNNVVVDQGEEEEKIPHVRPIRIGSSDPPTIHPRDKKFVGRGGVWHCEFCNKATVLPPSTKQWTCRQCQRTMYTLPQEECPLDTFCPCCCWDQILG